MKNDHSKDMNPNNNKVVLDEALQKKWVRESLKLVEEIISQEEFSIEDERNIAEVIRRLKHYCTSIDGSFIANEIKSIYDKRNIPCPKYIPHSKYFSKHK